MLSLGLGLSLTKAGSSGGSPLQPFALWTWFLKNDTWDLAGQWIDSVAWTPNWFLTTGIINVYGSWADSEAWA